jgi:urease
VHDPICSEDGNLHNALYGSFLPIPSNDLFPLVDAKEYERANGPGAVIVKPKSPITINPGRGRIRLKVKNNGDRPIQARVLYFNLSLTNIQMIQ